MKEFKSIDDVLDFAILNEEDAIRFYTDLADTAKDEAMKKVFTQIAHEEIGHKSRLMSIKEYKLFHYESKKIEDLKISDYIVTAEITGAATYQDILIVAMQKEKAAFRLYTKLAEEADEEEMKNVFFGLAQEESKHKLRFEIEYDDNVLKEN